MTQPETATPGRTLKCAVVTPVGPGHEDLYRECMESATRAVACSKGPFTDVIAIKVDDTGGKLGRSHARNLGVLDAVRQGADWIFFLDADDLMVDTAFEVVTGYIDRYDAIWGQIYSFVQGDREAVKRPGQVEATEDIDDILNNDPFLTLQMGHFVRTPLAYAQPFDETMNTGEDFDYYLRVWRAGRCIKIPQPLFANRRGLHSTGERSATGHEWRGAVGRVMNRFARIGEAPATATSATPTLDERLAAAATALLPANAQVLDLAAGADVPDRLLGGTHGCISAERWLAQGKTELGRPVWLAALTGLERISDLRTYLREAVRQQLPAVVAYRPSHDGEATVALDRQQLTAAIHQAGYGITDGRRVDDVLVLQLTPGELPELREAAA